MPKYRTARANFNDKYWDSGSGIHIEELDEDGLGNENYIWVDKLKYWQLCHSEQITDYKELGSKPDLLESDFAPMMPQFKLIASMKWEHYLVSLFYILSRAKKSQEVFIQSREPDPTNKEYLHLLEENTVTASLLLITSSLLNMFEAYKSEKLVKDIDSDECEF